MPLSEVANRISGSASGRLFDHFGEEEHERPGLYKRFDAADAPRREPRGPQAAGRIMDHRSSPRAQGLDSAARPSCISVSVQAGRPGARADRSRGRGEVHPQGAHPGAPILPDVLLGSGSGPVCLMWQNKFTIHVNWKNIITHLPPPVGGRGDITRIKPQKMRAVRARAGPFRRIQGENRCGLRRLGLGGPAEPVAKLPARDAGPAKIASAAGGDMLALRRPP